MVNKNYRLSMAFLISVYTVRYKLTAYKHIRNKPVLNGILSNDGCVATNTVVAHIIATHIRIAIMKDNAFIFF